MFVHNSAVTRRGQIISVRTRSIWRPSKNRNQTRKYSVKKSHSESPDHRQSVVASLGGGADRQTAPGNTIEGVTPDESKNVVEFYKWHCRRKYHLEGGKWKCFMVSWKCFMIARKGHQLSRTMTKKVVIAFEEK